MNDSISRLSGNGIYQKLLLREAQVLFTVGLTLMMSSSCLVLFNLVCDQSWQCTRRTELLFLGGGGLRRDVEQRKVEANPLSVRRGRLEPSGRGVRVRQSPLAGPGCGELPSTDHRSAQEGAFFC